MCVLVLCSCNSCWSLSSEGPGKMTHIPLWLSLKSPSMPIQAMQPKPIHWGLSLWDPIYVSCGESLLGFVMGNPWVGYFNTIPMTWQPAPSAVMGLHHTHSLWVSLRCDDNPPRVTKPHQNCSIVAIPRVLVLSSLSKVSLYYSNVMHE